MASDWRPAGWLADMDSMTTQQAEEVVTAAREALAALHQVQAVSEAEAQSAGEAKDALPILQDSLKTATDQSPGHPRRSGRAADHGCRGRGQGGRKSPGCHAEFDKGHPPT